MPSAATKLDEVYIRYNGVKVDLKDAPAKLPNFGYKDQMTLHVAASFGAGTDKTISITLPEGLSFRDDVQSSKQYVVNGTDATLAGKTISGVGADILGERQYNGTLTLRFHGQGESNDAKAVAFDVPIYSAWRNSRNSGLWESGTAWFYDKLPNSKVTEPPVVVKQSITITNPDGSQTTNHNQNQLDELTMKYEEEKAYGKSWNSPLNPEIKVGGQMSGNESFWVKPLPNGGTYTNPTAYQEYSITYLAPEKAVFKGFKNPNPGSGASATPDYNGAPPTITAPGNTTPGGKTVPTGYKAYTFTVRNEIISPKELTMYPMWSFPAADYPSGTEVTISVDDVKVRYYGREYGPGDYEKYDPLKYPSLTYKIKGEYEEVYALVNYQDSRRITDGKVYDSTLYMGAPGYEFNQERSAGYFFFGNRGLKDSEKKQVTITYDVGNTGKIGVTQQRLPQNVAGDHTISGIKVKTWNPATGASLISGWIPYTGGRTLNLRDLGIRGNSGIYLKEITFQMDTIPARSLISDAASRDKNSYSNSESYLYRFHAKVLKGDAVAVTSERIENKIEIANVTPLTAPTAGDEKNSGEGQNSKYMTIVGRTFNGLQGKSLVLGNTLDYDPNNQVKAGEEGHVKSKVHFHAWTPQNAQLIDAIYLISPYGEDFTNIRMHYSRGGGFPIQNKKYLKDENAPQPNITEQPASDALRARYRDAKVYKLDFTGITDAQKKYDARLVGGNVLSQASLLNTPLSTDSQYNGSWISYDYKPKISDPYGTYSDLMWVEYYADTDKDVEYRREENHNVKLFDDIYKLLGDNPKKKLIGRMDPITILPTEELTVSSSAKKEQEVDSMYRTYDPRNPETIMKMRREANYKLRVQNFTSNPVTEFSVYFPIPKEGQDWGNTINPEGKFQYNNVLRHGLSRVPKGFRVYYAKNVNPTAHYENWDDENWTEQDATDRWSPSDWKEVNFVKMVWVGTDDHKAIVNQDDYQAVFDLGVDEGVTEAQMGKKNVWQPYFLRKYTNSTSWVAGEPVAAMLSPGIIKGTVWVDQNVNGVLNGKKDPGEEAAAGVKVQLYDVGNPVNPVLKEEVTTGANGAYRFEGLVNGNYSSGNQYKVVVNRDANTYSSFTIRGVNMVFKPDDDQNTASLEVSPAPETEEKSYDVGLVKPGIVMDAPIVHKKVTGANARPETFVFEWTAVPDPNTLPAGRSYLPMPNGLNAESVQASLQTGTEKEMTLGSLSFTQAGTYAYRLKEINTGAANYTYDETSYTITYEIRIDENTHQTIGKRTIERGGELLPAASACTFTNTYVAPGGGTTPGTSGETPGTNPGTPGIRGGSVPQGGDVLGARRGTEGKSEKPSLLDSPAVLGMRRALTGDGFDLAMHTGAAVLCSCAAVLLILAGGEQKKKGSR